MIQVLMTIGEAIDRHIILTLKAESQPQNEALQSELQILGASIDHFRKTKKLDPAIQTEVARIEAELTSVNIILWDLEDKIREQIHALMPQLTDVVAGKQPRLTNATQKVSDLTATATSIVENNDLRSRLKKEFSGHFGESGSDSKIYTTVGEVNVTGQIAEAAKRRSQRRSL